MRQLPVAQASTDIEPRTGNNLWAESVLRDDERRFAGHTGRTVQQGMYHSPVAQGALPMEENSGMVSLNVGRRVSMQKLYIPETCDVENRCCVCG